MIYGYCRISTSKQNIERQVRNIKNVYAEAVILQEVYTGTKSTRPKWQQLLKGVKAGDVIVFDSVSRMSRNAEEGFAVYKELYNKGVDLIFLKEPYVNTQTFRETTEKQLIGIKVETGDKPTDVLMNTIIQALNDYTLQLAEKQIQIAFDQSEKEVSDLQQRTREGIVTARLEGKQIGRQQGTQVISTKSIQAKLEMLQKLKCFGGYLMDTEAMELMKIAKNSFYKYKAELKEEFGEVESKEELIEKYKELKASRLRK